MIIYEHSGEITLKERYFTVLVTTFLHRPWNLIILVALKTYTLFDLVTFYQYNSLTNNIIDLVAFFYYDIFILLILFKVRRSFISQTKESSTESVIFTDEEMIVHSYSDIKITLKYKDISKIVETKWFLKFYKNGTLFMMNNKFFEDKEHIEKQREILMSYVHQYVKK